MVERIGNEDGVEFGANVEAAESILVAQADTGTSGQPAPAPTATETRVVVELEDGAILRLPATASVDQPRENGTDLEFVQPDGSVIVVPNGAIQGLTIFIGNAEIPPLTVAALFEANGIEAAAGPAGAGAGARGSGGNFEVPVGGIGDAFALGDLLDPTELAFGTPAFEDLYPANSRPSFGSDLFGLALSEEGLTFGIPDANPAGSDTTDNAYFLINLGASDPDGDSLTFTFGEPNSALFSNGQQVVWEGVGTDHLVGRVGSVTVIDITVGGPTGIVFVRLMQPIDHPAQGEDVVRFGLTVTANDGRGGTATTTLNIGIEDDSPVIGNSTSVSVDEDGLSNGVNNTDSPGDNNDANRISATGSLNIRWGADNGDAADGLNADGSFAQDAIGRAVYFSQADFDAFVLANGGLKSGGNGLTFTLTGNGTIITAYTAGGEGAEGTPVFRISLSDDGAGQYKFQLLGQLDHPKTSDGESESSSGGGFEDDIVLNLNFTAKDADGDLANGKFSVVIDDDMPVVKIVTTESTVTHDESAWPQNPLWNIFGPGGDRDDNDVGVVASVLRVSQYFSGVVNTGNDPDVPDLAKLFFHGAIGYAESSKALIAVDVAFGADGAAATNSLVYSLVLGTAESSGLKTTDGQPISLFAENGIIVGRVGGAEGPAAIALYIDAGTGKVTIAQWLSLQHDTINSHDEFTSLAQGAVLVKVTATDGDGDSASASADISTRVRFEDDGPTLKWFSVKSGGTISHDETPGVDTDANDTSANVSGLFAGIAGGTDLHVGGAVGYAQVSGNSLFSIGADFGSDGKHSTNAYKFALSVGEATTALKTSEGNDIRLELDASGRIVGVVVGGTFNGKAAFALYIDPATGDVTLAQYLSLQHNNTGSSDELISLAANNVRVTLTVTDGDGDIDSKIVNIGSKIGFQDDGPSVVVTANGNSTVTHDESPGPQNAIWNWFGPSGDSDDDDVGIIASIAKVSGLFSGVPNQGNDPDVSDLDKLFFKGAIGYAQSDKPLVSYTANFGADGAAATGSVKYSLQLGNPASGLKTTEGHDIALKLVDGIIIGEVVSGPFQGQAAFALHIDQQTGKVTMAQWLSLQHGTDPLQHDDAISLAQGSVSVKVTVEDRDGDTHSHSADVSNQIRFEDDGPTLDKFGTNANAQIVHDETPGLQGDDTNANVSGLFTGLGTAMGHAAVAGTSLFSVSASFGSDGKPLGETGYTFKLSVGQSTTSLKTVDGEAIVLSLENGLIVGRIGSGEAAFAIHIDAATGNVTLAQYLPIKHVAGDHNDVRFLAANNIKVTLTVTDGDGDTVTSKAVSIGDKIGFRDDGPDAVVDGSVALPVLTVDESNGAGSGQDGKLVASASFADNFGTVIKYGADGAGSVGYTLKLEGTNVGSGLYAVDPAATDGKGSEIILKQSGGVITGSLGGVDYFTITVDATGKVTFTLTGNSPVWHANTGDHDDASTLNVGANKLLLTQTVTDADGDKDSASIDIGSNGVFKVEDDGPVLTVAPSNGLANGLFFSGFTSNSPQWGEGSGYTSGTAGEWKITSSTVGGFGSTELQRVGDGYRGADSPTDSVMVDMEASPGNVAISQDINGLVAGQIYRLSFEIGEAADAVAGSALLRVIWNGTAVGTYDPQSGIMQTIVLNLEAIAGTNSLTFEEIGTAGDNTGTFLANVQINDLIIIIDESAGIQPDSDEVNGAGVAGLFSGLQVGVDPNMAPQYAQGSGAIVDSTVNYGADGEGTALAYAFNITAGATSLKTTSGQTISLALDDGRVVGTYMDGGTSKVAFALHLNSSTGVVTVAQFVSLEHPIQGSSHDEGLYLPAGSVHVSVTATDGDGDKATASSDITGLIRFEDDGPQTGAATFTALGAELIKNGGFEDGHNLGSGSNWNLFNSIDHWTKSGNIPFEVQTGNAGGTGNNSAVVELDGDSESQGGAAPSTDGTNASIEQLVQGLVAGQTYQLSFGYAPRTNGDVNTAGLEVWFGNKLVFPVGNATYPANAWTTVTITVTATGEDAILRFVGTGAGDEFGALIDDVSLRASYGGLDDDSQPHGNPGGIDDDADGKMLVGNLNINAGADGLKSIVFDDAAKAPFKAIWLDNEGVGHQMDVKLVWEAGADGGGVLKGTMEVNGQPVPVLTLTVGKDGSFMLAMHAPLAHAEPGAVPNNEDNLLLDLGYTVTDGDGDTDSGTLSVTVDDDTPDFIDGGVEDITVGTVNVPQVGDLNIAFGADGQKATGGLKISGYPEVDGVFTKLSEGGLTLTGYLGSDDKGTKLYTLTLDQENGKYSFIQHQNLAASNSLATIPLTGGTSGPSIDYGSIKITALAGDNMHQTGAGLGIGQHGGGNIDHQEQFQIDFDNNMRTTELGIKFEGNGTMQLNWVAYEDGVQVASGSTSPFGANGTVLISPDGSISFDSLVLTAEAISGNNPKFKLTSIGGQAETQIDLEHLNFTVTATDGDGDSVSSDFIVTLESDDKPKIEGVPSGLVLDEDTLPAGNDDSNQATEQAVTEQATGSVVVDFGNDVPANLLESFSFLTTGLNNQLQTSTGTSVTFSIAQNGDLVGSAAGDEVVRIILTGAVQNGTKVTYTYEASLNAAVRHSSNPEEDSRLLDNVGFEIEDGTGDKTAGNFDVTVWDDAPTVSAAINASATGVVEGQSLTGTWSHHYGADDAGATAKVVVGGVEYDIGQQISITGLGNLVVNAGGTWTFQALNNLNNLPTPPSVNFTVKVTDGDGDTALAPVTFTITDGDGPSISYPGQGTALGLEVEESDIDIIGSSASGNDEIDSGTLTFTSGSDAITSVVFANPNDDSNTIVANAGLNEGVTIAWNLSIDGRTLTGSIGGQPAIKLELSGDQTANAGGATISAGVKVTLTDNFPHQDNVNAADLVLSGIKVIAAEADGENAIGAVTVKVVDDVPTAVADTKAMSEDAASVSGNVLTNDNAWADGGKEVTTAGTFTGTYGTLVLGTNGQYTYTLKTDAATQALIQALTPGNKHSDTFNYTMKDGDGDTAPTTLTIEIEGADDGVTLFGLGTSGGEVTVNENDLSDGSSPNAAALTQTGTFTFTAVDGVGSVKIGATVLNLSGTFPQTVADDATGKLVVTGYSFNAVTGTGTVNYAYTLEDKTLAHGPANNGPNDVQVSFAVEVKDSNNTTATGSLDVKIVDDVPIAVGEGVSVAAGSLQTVDAQFIVDRSGSMFPGAGGSVGFDVPGFSDDRIGLARYSIQQMLLSNPQIQNIQIIGFGDSATASAWMTREAAQAFVSTNSNWSDLGGTNYDAALTKAMEAYVQTRPLGVSDKTVVYFMSDGEPTSPWSSPGITSYGDGSDVSIAEWESFVTSKGISQVYAIGLGNGVTTANLNPISYPNTDVAAPSGVEDNVIIVNTANLTQLNATMQGLMGSASSVNGNILTNDGFGADGGYIRSVEIDGRTYTFNGTSVTASGNALSGHALLQNGGTFIKVTTAMGGEVTFYFENSTGQNAGNWYYLAPPNAAGNDTIKYTLVDGDGDQSSASLTVTVTAPPPQISISDATVQEGGLLTFTVSLSNTYGQPVSVNYATEHGTAKVADYTSLSGTLTFAAGETTKTITVQTTQDSIAELSEKMVLKLSSATNATIVDGKGVGTITDNDSRLNNAPQVAYSQADVGSTAGNAKDISHLGYTLSNDSDISDAASRPSATISSQTTSGEYEWYKLVIDHSGTTIYLDLDNTQGTFDPSMTLFKADGTTVVAQNDDGEDGGNGGYDSFIEKVLDAGTYFIRIGSYRSGDTYGTANGTYAYELQVSIVPPTAIDPIVLDLDGNGHAFTSLTGGVSFDLDGDGSKDQVAWSNGGDGMLAFDANGNGSIDNGTELFTPWFNGGKFASGSEALASLDTNGDGVIDARDEAFAKLAIWQDANGDGITDAGELRSLADHGIASISVGTASRGNEVDGQSIVGEGTFTRTDGTTAGYVEVHLDTAFGAGEKPTEGNGSKIVGMDGDDFLVGTDGDDIIIGGLGNDTLTGGAGADTFVFSEAGPDNADTITDFVTGEDTIDLGALLDAALIDANNVGEYVRVQDTGADALLQVNTAGTGDNWVDVATLTGHGTPGTVIDLKIDDEHHVVQIPTI